MIESGYDKFLASGSDYYGQPVGLARNARRRRRS